MVSVKQGQEYLAKEGRGVITGETDEFFFVKQPNGTIGKLDKRTVIESMTFNNLQSNPSANSPQYRLQAEREMSLAQHDLSQDYELKFNSNMSDEWNHNNQIEAYNRHKQQDILNKQKEFEANVQTATYGSTDGVMNG